MDNSLAILVPAWKGAFLARALDSLAAQTDKSFTVYVADDASGEDLGMIVGRFSDRMDIVYRRFDENLGSKDLVAAWERNVGMASQEWIWLFSDDDLMPDDAVARFREAQKNNPGEKFFRFPLCSIDARGEQIYPPNSFVSAKTDPESFLLEYLCGKRMGATCEYVFHRSLFEKRGMVHFPLAWCSDVASWYSYAVENGGVVNIPGNAMMWRNVEGVNISSTSASNSLKVDAVALFMAWLADYYRKKSSLAFRSALRNYLGMILKYSLGGHFDREALLKLSRAYAKISPLRALNLYTHYKKYTVG